MQPTPLQILGLLLVFFCTNLKAQLFPAPNLQPDPQPNHPNQPQVQPTGYGPIDTVDKAFSVLKDGNETPTRWGEAAIYIASPVRQRFMPVSLEGPLPSKAYLCTGEALRTTMNPSVSDLLIKRMDDSLDVVPPASDLGGGGGEVFASFKLAQALAFWDGKNHLRELKDFTQQAGNIPVNDHKILFAKELLDILGKLLDLQDNSEAQQIINIIGTTAPTEVVSPAEVASPRYGESGGPDLNILACLWQRPNNPILAQSLDHFFVEPEHGWSPIIDPQRKYQLIDTLWTPLLGLPSYRKAAIDGLQKTDVVSQVTKSELPRFLTPYGLNYWNKPSVTDLSDLPFDLRFCDLCAMALAEWGEAPDFDPTWETSQKDQAITKMIAFLNQYGNAFQYKEPGEDNLMHPNRPSEASLYDAYFHLDQLNQPATAADVQAGRAIFNLNAPGAKVIPLNSVPVIIYQKNDVTGNAATLEVWQAESLVDERGLTHKYYGYTGNHQIGHCDGSSLDANSLAILTAASSPLSLSRAYQSLHEWSINPSVDGVVEPLNVRYVSGNPIILSFKLKNNTEQAISLPVGFCPTPDQRTMPIALSLALAIPHTTADDNPLGGTPSVISPTQIPQNGFRQNGFNQYRQYPVPQRMFLPATWAPLFMKPQPASVFVPPPPPTTPPTIPANGEYVLGSFDLTTLYDLSKPGVYLLKIGNPGQENGVLNITFSISPQ